MDVLAMTAVRRVWAIGLCGGLQETVACGDLVIPSSAYGDENTSQHYDGTMPSQADNAMVEAASARAKDAGLACHVGSMWTTDAILRETDAKIADWHTQGLLAVDMETSAFFTVASARELKAAAVLVASDNPFMSRITDYPAIKRGYTNAIELLFACLGHFV
jgi:purine-nucleoside phosphorylase